MLQTAAFNLVGYAQDHRYRVRNLHDGDPVPPTRPQSKRRVAFSGQENREDAIVCRWGYVTLEGDRLCWVLLAESVGRLNKRLPKLAAIPGLVIQQSGDTEASGTAPVQAIDEVLAVLEPYRRGRGNPSPNTAGLHRSHGHAGRLESTQAGLVGG